PHLLRRADALHRQPERRGRRHRREGRAGEGPDRDDARARPPGASLDLLVGSRPPRMRLESRVRTNDPEFRANVAHMQTLVGELRAARAEAARGGSDEARRRHTERGKLLPRERIERLLDPGAPFLELSPLAAFGCYDGDAPGASMVTGIGRIAGR